ncbi:hypothetical protein FGO68_gene224 [Halteria grandinella]|uniref:Uncharacterized protein n=1 Tax=Halteria grandinella TaxID=5974 RepID=A0A8J8T8U9_HALGN|nr:hypothetical protein FGO68_gene224 [Halteria grandinella]
MGQDDFTIGLSTKELYLDQYILRSLTSGTPVQQAVVIISKQDYTVQTIVNSVETSDVISVHPSATVSISLSSQLYYDFGGFVNFKNTTGLLVFKTQVEYLTTINTNLLPSYQPSILTLTSNQSVLSYKRLIMSDKQENIKLDEFIATSSTQGLLTSPPFTYSACMAYDCSELPSFISLASKYNPWLDIGYSEYKGKYVVNVTGTIPYKRSEWTVVEIDFEGNMGPPYFEEPLTDIVIMSRDKVLEYNFPNAIDPDGDLYQISAQIQSYLAQIVTFKDGLLSISPKSYNFGVKSFKVPITLTDINKHPIKSIVMLKIKFNISETEILQTNISESIYSLSQQSLNNMLLKNKSLEQTYYGFRVKQVNSTGFMTLQFNRSLEQLNLTIDCFSIEIINRQTNNVSSELINQQGSQALIKLQFKDQSRISNTNVRFEEVFNSFRISIISMQQALNCMLL